MKSYDKIKQDRLKASLKSQPSTCSCAKPETPETPEGPTAEDLRRDIVQKLAGVLLKTDAS